MASYRMDSEEEAALFRSYAYALYFVQSPSSATINPCSPPPPQALALSRYSSSRGSNNSFIKKCSSGDHDVTAGILMKSNGGCEEDDHHHQCQGDDDGVNGNRSELYEYLYDDDDDGGERKRGWIQYFSFSYSNSGWWILLQLSWRFLLSFLVALLVFYAAVKPPSPAVSVKVARIGQFRLGEGVDGSGVTTKILSCNCIVTVTIDNKSKLFALHIRPPSMELLFGRLPLATRDEDDRDQVHAAAGSNDISTLKLSVGTKNRAMYGGGREMQDLLESGKGLPLQIEVSLRSSFHVVWGLFNPKFHHHAHCLVALADKYDKKHRTQVYNSTCIVSES